MPRDPHERAERAGHLHDGRSPVCAPWEADWLAAGRLPPGERLRTVAGLTGAVEKRPGLYRGDCPACGGRNCYTVRLDSNGDAQRNCFGRPRGDAKGGGGLRIPCTREAIQAAAPASYALLFAAPLPSRWAETTAEHGGWLVNWLAGALDAARAAAPRRRAGARDLLTAFGAASSRAGAREFDAACSSLALDAGRSPRSLYGSSGLIAVVLALPERPVERRRVGGPRKRAGRWTVEASRWRLRLTGAAAAGDLAPVEPPNLTAGDDFGRATRGTLHVTLTGWPDAGGAPWTVNTAAEATGQPRSTVRRHFARLLLLGLAVELVPDAGADAERGRGRPPRTLVLLPAVADAIACGDPAALVRLANLAPSRWNLRERAAAKVAKAARDFAAEVAAPGWPWAAKERRDQRRRQAAERAAWEARAAAARDALDDAAAAADGAEASADAT